MINKVHWIIFFFLSGVGSFASDPAEFDKPEAESSSSVPSENTDEQFLDAEVMKQIASLEMKKTGIIWAKPDFTKQSDALGWSDSTFKVPPGFQDRVNFWID
jgi:hypothetical protein